MTSPCISCRLRSKSPAINNLSRSTTNVLGVSWVVSSSDFTACSSAAGGRMRNNREPASSLRPPAVANMSNIVFWPVTVYTSGFSTAPMTEIRRLRYSLIKTVTWGSWRYFSAKSSLISLSNSPAVRPFTLSVPSRGRLMFPWKLTRTVSFNFSTSKTEISSRSSGPIL